MGELKVVGKSVPTLDSLEKVTGKARFTADFRTAGLLYGKVLRSPYPHARIISIDVSKAERLAGVRSIITPQDVPPVPLSVFLGDQYALCRDNIVRCVGDPVAALAADTEDIAEEAVKLIEVTYEELPAVFDVEEAFRTDPPVIVHPDLPKYKQGPDAVRLLPDRPNVCQTLRVRSGDVKKGFQDADLIIENRFSTSRVQHCQMEPHTADVWCEPDGSLTVRSSNQSAHGRVSLLSAFFNLPPSKVRILSPYTGGGFGGKGTRGRAEPIAALLAWKCGKPVRLAFSREEMFAAGGHRPAFLIDIKDGVKRDGTIVAREVRILLELGAYSDNGFFMVSRAPGGVVGTYRIPNFKLDSYGVYTNIALSCSFRGFGCPETEWAVEQQMDSIAEKLGIDPVALRKKNILHEGDKDAYGMITRSMGVRECLDKVVDWIGWGEEPAQEAGPWKRGKGIAIGNKSVMVGSTSVVIVKVWRDGMIEIRHSASQIGQGISTTLAQIAAEEFDVPLERVQVVCGDTAFCPYDAGSVSSRSLIHDGNALLFACRDAKQQLFKLAAPKLGADPGELATVGGKIFIKTAPDKSMSIGDLFMRNGAVQNSGEILGTGSYTGPGIEQDHETGQSERPVVSYSHGAVGVEVAVNRETGEVKILKIAGAFDAGKAINPKIVEQQIEGGVTMAVGTALYEQIVFDKGAVVNDCFTDYHIPSTLDVPMGENTKSAIIEVPHAEGPFGAKGIGEVTVVPAAPAIASAIYNAIGVRVRDLPVSRERVLKAIREKASSQQ